MAKLTILRGDTYTLTINVTNTSGTAYDLTGYKAFLTVVTALDNTGGVTTDPTAVLTKTITPIPSPTTGVITFALSAADTNLAASTYYYDVQIEDGSGNVTTILAPDQLIVKPDVTRRLV